MSNIVKDTDNRWGVINQTTIRNYLIFKPKKWLKKTFQKDKYYQSLHLILRHQLNKKVQTFKDNKKYIPDIFLELDDVKEKLRYITQPILFYKKNIDEIKNVEFYFFNEVLENLGITKKNLDISIRYSSPKTQSELNETIEQLMNDFLKFKESIPNFDDRKEMENKLSEEKYKLLIKEQGLNHRFGRFLDNFEKKFRLLQKQFILLTEQAGQGKTNLVCDFVENVMLKKNLLGVMFTGNEFNNLHRDKIEDIILKEIYGFESGIEFNEFFDDIEYLCKSNNTTFTIIIDGLNENINIKYFSKELYSFVEEILKKDFIRLIFTCRSEYFDDRFKNFKEPSFLNKMEMQESFMNRYKRYREEFPEHLEDRLISSYMKFFQIKSTLSPNVRATLANNFLLLRMFSEVYGTKDNPTAPVEQVYNIYKDDLFKKYFEFKHEQINVKTKYGSTELKKLFESILKYMVETNIYTNISLDNIEDIDLELLEHIIDEDIFFRKDLIKDESSIYANSEVLNFTFDEFRDYLLADYIVNNEKIDPKIFLESIDENMTIREGVERYLFFKSRKKMYKVKLQFLEELEYYDNLFLSNIFSVSDEDINDDDIHKIKDLFIQDVVFSKKIINHLMYRHITRHYIKLNIFTLFDIILSLNDDEYSTFVSEKYKIKYDYYSYQRERKGGFLQLLEDLYGILETRNFSKEYQLHNVFEFMFLLLGVTDETAYGSSVYELTELLENYIDKYPENAKKILLKYEDINIEKIKLEIWKLLNYYINKQIDFDNEFYKETFKKFIGLEDGILKNNILRFLEKCYKLDSSWCTSEEHSFFKDLENEEKTRMQFFRDVADGKADLSELLEDLDI
ncbi:hypothetical protein [Sulfurimonas sp.]|uniref:NACHT domain-containing protein n=1 Tax=Sulfurimonas sp. TaxID=2022749 RepID=UPI002636484D|nr:hypothetical protein [Sulfurimonas sp.]MCW8895016.1 hypothetical protein [Sulfurimonas sp.]